MWRTSTILIGAVLVLVALGLVMLASTSAIQAAATYNDPHFYVKRQAGALIVGTIGALLVSRIRPSVWKRFAIVLAVLSLILLVAVLIPGIGIVVKGSRRWVSLGITTMQPSETMKIGMVFMLAWWMTRYKRRADELGVGALAPFALLLVMIVPILAEPDYGTTFLLGLVGLSMLWIAGTRFSYLLVFGAVGAAGMTIMIMSNEVRMRRIIAFLDPERYADKEAFQLLNAIYAFVMGGGHGAGLGGSLQKRYYLPEAHTDFIFAIIGEELGIAASLGVLVLFAVIFICGLRIASRAHDSFSRLVAFGLACVIGMQAAFNIGVVTGVLPTKGIPLPFISYGGTSLTISLVMVGLLIGIARHTDEDGSPLAAQRKNNSSGR